MNKEDTIAAIATAPGEGGIGIVRISGELAETILRSVFVPMKNRGMENAIYKVENRKLSYGMVVDPKTGAEVDEVLAVFMKRPGTYTAEDVAEIHCHGSMVSLQKTLELALENGARLAEPGEFTKRAFLNGRIDLSQAEAVIDVIRAKTEDSYKAALGQLSGRLSEQIGKIRAQLVDALVELTVNIDYPDEDIEVMTYEKLESQMEAVRGEIAELAETGYTGRILREGLNTVIAGKPNVGKSSLMNRLLRETRSIVTEIPGTTRDTIQEQLNIGGILLNITDTAGIRKTGDLVEKIGVEKSLESLKRADLVLFLLDQSRPLDDEDRLIARELKERENVILLVNKTDEAPCWQEEEARELVPAPEIIRTSMVSGEGLKELEEKIREKVYGGRTKPAENVLVTGVRHLNLLKNALKSAEDALNMIHEKEPLELIEIDVNETWRLLGEITGDAVQEDIINEVFSRFCLGK
ncbi:MAG: tRNA uridine-5-carboxymethylaminomethyl(34) synthesis GTPase MnmE [Firmicutes bacterium]|nr:tRNA uridine-5-carboxymethylaminomethyl(34) synthesis GTPase MnmE [Bacillota bacterium]